MLTERSPKPFREKDNHSHKSASQQALNLLSQCSPEGSSSLPNSGANLQDSRTAKAQANPAESESWQKLKHTRLRARPPKLGKLSASNFAEEPGSVKSDSNNKGITKKEEDSNLKNPPQQNKTEKSPTLTDRGLSTASKPRPLFRNQQTLRRHRKGFTAA